MKKLLQKIWPNREVLKKDIRAAVAGLLSSLLTVIVFWLLGL